MRPLDFDFAYEGSPLKKMGYVLLILSVLIAIALLNYYRNLKMEDEQLAAELRLSKRGESSRTFMPKESLDSDEMKHFQIIVQRLELPWRKLFSAVERSDFDDVALLSLQPDLKKRAINITAEAKNEGAMFEYLRKLNATGSFVDVHLLSHQIQQTDPQRPFQFTVMAIFEK